MEIIKKGRDQKGWSEEFTCSGKGNGGGGCGAVLLVSQLDLYSTQSSSYDGSTEYYTTFSCPCCGVETDVTVPSNVLKLGKRPQEYCPIHMIGDPQCGPACQYRQKRR